MRSLIVNIYGGPGSGKSTRANYIASALKLEGIPCEVCPEFAKEEIHRGMPENLKDQKYIFGNQQHILKKLSEIYPIIINDGALLNCIVYDLSGDKRFHDIIYDTYLDYTNLDYFLKRDNNVKFVQEGRVHNLEESIQKDREILNTLNDYNVNYKIINREDRDTILNNIRQWYNDNFKN